MGTARSATGAAGEGAKVFVPLVCGLSFYWLFLRRSYFGLLFSSHSGAGLDAQTCYWMFMLPVAIGAVAAFFGHAWVESLLVRHPRCVLVLSIFAAFGGVLVYAAPMLSAGGAALTVLGIVLLAANFLLLTFAWGMVAGSCSGSAAIPCVTLSFVLSYAIAFLFLTPNPVPVLVVLVAPLVSGVCWAAAAGCMDTSSQEPASHGFSELKKAPLAFMAVLALFLLVGGVMRGFTYSGSIDYVPSHDSIFPNVISIIFASMMLLIEVFAKHIERILRFVWAIFAILFFAGLFFMAAFGADWSGVGRAILISGRSCLGFLLWATAVNAVRIYRLSPVSVLSAFFLIVEMASSFLSYFVVPAVVSFSGISFDSYIALLSMAMAFLLVVASFLFLSRESLHDAMSDNDAGAVADADDTAGLVAPSADVWQQACESVAERCGLTKRELEVMLLVSRGHSKKKIAEELFVSEGTIQTHTKNIYRKLGLHSRQDLIDLIAAEAGVDVAGEVSE